MSLFARASQRVLVTAFVIVSLTLSLLVFAPAEAAEEPSFADPTATAINPLSIHLGSLVYVGPFAVLKAGTDAAHEIVIGGESNVQDSVVVDATNGAIHLGEKVILAHGSRVKGKAQIGEAGTCPGGAAVKVCPSFVSFNAEVDGATVEKDAMVGALARVGPGVTIPSGRKVLPGKNVTSNSEVATKTAPLVEGDRTFMDGVIEVNVAFAHEYPTLAREDATNVRGINYNPGNSTFNHDRHLPMLAGQSTRDPLFRNRIIGDVQLKDNKAALDRAMGQQVSLRADEGEAFEVGTIARMGDRTTLHALEHTHLQLGNSGTYGRRSIVHGGPTPFGDNTISGENLNLGEGAVFFRSRVGANVTIGARSLVQESDLPAGTIVPARTIIVAGQNSGTVEWEATADEPLPTVPAPMPGLPSTGSGSLATQSQATTSTAAVRWLVVASLLLLLGAVGMSNRRARQQA